MSFDSPLPKPNADTRPFWEGCRRKELRFQKCRDCGHVRWPPSIMCPECHATDTEWIVADGRGVIYSYVVYHVAFHPAFKDKLPYVTAVVELHEGPRILTNIVDCDPSALRCDMPVEVIWGEIDRKLHLHRFRPAGANRVRG
jgi:uncharacterized OB-fold protein